MISDRYKFIFVHINKCAGRSIENSLPSGTRGHHTIMYYRNLCEREHRDYANYLKFTFVRNPWDKVVSFYHYHRSRGWDLFPWTRTTAPDFDTFIQKLYVENGGSLAYEIFKGRGGESSHRLRLSNSLDWVTDANGNILVDFIGKVENLQADFDVVCDRIGVGRRPLPHDNGSKHESYWVYYNDESRRIVAEKFCKDIESFDYRFGQ